MPLTMSSTTSSGIATTPPVEITVDQSSALPTEGYTYYNDNMSKVQNREQLVSVVQQFFPPYKPDAWLRCSVLFPPKPSSLPRLWHDCKKPRKRKKQTECSSPKKLRFGKTPPPEMCLSDDEVSMLKFYTLCKKFRH